MEQDAGRKHPAHWSVVRAPQQTDNYFLTVCAKDRKRILASPDGASAIIDAWRNAKTWLVGRYVIMPNHIHTFLCTGLVSARATKAMGALLEEPCITELAAPYTSIQFGNAIFGTRSCVGTKITTRNGIM